MNGYCSTPCGCSAWSSRWRSRSSTTWSTPRRVAGENTLIRCFPPLENPPVQTDPSSRPTLRWRPASVKPGFGWAWPIRGVRRLHTSSLSCTTCGRRAVRAALARRRLRRFTPRRAWNPDTPEWRVDGGTRRSTASQQAICRRDWVRRWEYAQGGGSAAESSTRPRRGEHPRRHDEGGVHLVRSVTMKAVRIWWVRHDEGGVDPVRCPAGSFTRPAAPPPARRSTPRAPCRGDDYEQRHGIDALCHGRGPLPARSRREGAPVGVAGNGEALLRLCCHADSAKRSNALEALSRYDAPGTVKRRSGWRNR